MLLFFGFLISLHSCSIIDQLIGNTTTEEIYSYFVSFLEGFAIKNGKNESKCVNVFIDKEKIETLINITSSIIDMVKKGETFEKILTKKGIDIITTPGLARYCNLLDAVPLYKNLSSIDFKNLDYFQLFLDYADDLYVIFREKDINKRASILGEYLSHLTDFKIK